MKFQVRKSYVKNWVNFITSKDVDVGRESRFKRTDVVPWWNFTARFTGKLVNAYHTKRVNRFLFNRICDCTNDDIFQHNYLTPILNSQYLSGINYLNAVAASSKNSNQSTPSTQTAPSTEKSALLEKLSTSLNQSLVSDGISSPWSDILSFAVEYPSYLEKSVHIIKVNSFI